MTEEPRNRATEAPRHRRSPALRLFCTALVVVVFACSRDTIDRVEWQRMSADDRLLYVQSLVGAEKAKDAKGGGGRDLTRPAAEYVRAIDAAYARGDRREAHQIFMELPH